MKMHICTQSPCPLEDEETYNILNAGFTTSYLDVVEDAKILSDKE